MAENLTRKLTWAEFAKVFQSYDTDGNCYIEDSELDKFLADLHGEENVPIDEYKAKIAGLSDDGKIGYLELASILLVEEENYLRQFKNEKAGITFVDFIKVWKHYDHDRSGYLGITELESFYLDLMTISTGKDRKTLDGDKELGDMVKAFAKATLHNVGGEDKQVSIKELASLLPVKNNVLKGLKKMAEVADFDKTFLKYDKDQSGCIDETELASLLNDMGLTDEKKKGNFSELFAQLDENKDGKIQKTELQLFFNK